MLSVSKDKADCTMIDKQIYQLYVLFLKKNARVIRYTDRKGYVEFELEWDGNTLFAPGDYTEQFVERKLFAFPKIYR